MWLELLKINVFTVIKKKKKSILHQVSVLHSRPKVLVSSTAVRSFSYSIVCDGYGGRSRRLKHVWALQDTQIQGSKVKRDLILASELIGDWISDKRSPSPSQQSMWNSVCEWGICVLSITPALFSFGCRRWTHTVTNCQPFFPWQRNMSCALVLTAPALIRSPSVCQTNREKWFSRWNARCKSSLSEL